MPCNVEIKARIDSVQTLLPRVQALCGQAATLIAQDDTFFVCPQGRLKLRQCAADRGELIFYRRADQAGPRASFYLRAPVSDPPSLRQCLTLAWGQAGRVRKQRMLFMAGRTRIHLDQVQGLGDFLELEVVLQGDEPPEDGVAEAQRLMAQLGIAPAQLVDRAYVDLLAPSGTAQNPPSAPSRPRVIYVDVDDTLVRSVGARRIPMPGVVQAVRALHAQGHTLYLWSSGGADYARQSAQALGLADCFAAFLPKPDAYIDDQPVHDWRFCQHVLPGNAADAGHPAHSLISDI